MLWFFTVASTPEALSAEVDIRAAFDAHGVWLLQLATRLTGSSSHGEDIVQEAFVVLYKKRDTLDATEDLRGWLYTVVKNLVHHHRRTIARQLRLSDKARHAVPVDDESASSPAAMIQRRQMGERVRRAVASLSLKHREVFVLYELQGLSGKAISEMVGIAEGTVWTRLHHARAAFEKAYAHLERSEGPV